MHATSDTSASYYQTAYDQDGYGGMQYYSSETCGYVNGSFVTTGCTTDYAQSEVKYVVDAWKNAQAPQATSARLITIDDLEDNLGYEQNPSVATQKVPNATNTPSWVYNGSYYYWTMSQYEDSASKVWFMYDSGNVGNKNVSYDVTSDYGYGSAVRPVITILKSELN